MSKPRKINVFGVQCVSTSLTKKSKNAAFKQLKAGAEAVRKAYHSDAYQTAERRFHVSVLQFFVLEQETGIACTQQELADFVGCDQSYISLLNKFVKAMLDDKVKLSPGKKAHHASIQSVIEALENGTESETAYRSHVRKQKAAQGSKGNKGTSQTARLVNSIKALGKSQKEAVAIADSIVDGDAAILSVAAQDATLVDRHVFLLDTLSKFADDLQADVVANKCELSSEQLDTLAERCSNLALVCNQAKEKVAGAVVKVPVKQKANTKK